MDDKTMEALLLGQRERFCKRGPDGTWLCKCGAVLTEGSTIQCDSCIEADEKRRREEQHRRKCQEHLSRIHHYAIKPLEHLPEWEHGRVDSEVFREKVHSRFQRFATKYEVGHGSVALLGPSGSGKTTACAAMFRRFAAEQEAAEIARKRWDISPELYQWSESVWTTAHQIAKARKQHKLGDDDAPLVLECMAAHLLVIDEMGFEPPSEALFEVVDTRYSKRRPTIVTSGLDSDGFAKRYGAAFLRRLTDDGVGTLVEVEHG